MKNLNITAQVREQLPINTVLESLGATIPDNLEMHIIDQPEITGKFKYSTLDEIPQVLALLSHEPSLDPAERKKLEAAVVGCIKAMEVVSETINVFTKKSWHNKRDYVSYLKKLAAAQSAVNLVGTEHPINEVISGRVILHNPLVSSELKVIFGNQNKFHARMGKADQVLNRQSSDVLMNRNKEATRLRNAKRERSRVAQEAHAGQNRIAKNEQDPDEQGLISKFE